MIAADTEMESLSRDGFGNKGWDVIPLRSLQLKQAGGAFWRTAFISILLSIISPDLRPGLHGTLINIQKTFANGENFGIGA